MRKFRVDFTGSCLVEVRDLWTNQLLEQNIESFDTAVISALMKAILTADITLEDVCPEEDTEIDEREPVTTP